jgi:hypothetical protein
MTVIRLSAPRRRMSGESVRHQAVHATKRGVGAFDHARFLGLVDLD